MNTRRDRSVGILRDISTTSRLVDAGACGPHEPMSNGGTNRLPRSHPSRPEARVRRRGTRYHFLMLYSAKCCVAIRWFYQGSVRVLVVSDPVVAATSQVQLWRVRFSSDTLYGADFVKGVPRGAYRYFS